MDVGSEAESAKTTKSGESEAGREAGGRGQDRGEVLRGATASVKGGHAAVPSESGTEGRREEDVYLLL